MQTKILRTLAIAFAMLTSVLPARAQNEIIGPDQQLPPEYNEDASFAWMSDAEKLADARWSDRVLERYAEELEAGKYSVVLQALADDFRAHPWPSHTDLQTRFQQRLDRLVFAFGEARAKAALDGALDTPEKRDAVKAALNAQGFGVQSLLPERARVGSGPFADSMVLVFFEGSPDRFATYRPVGNGDSIELLVPRALMQDLRLRAEAVRAVLQDFVNPIQQRAVDIIRQADRRWRNYLEHGYSQYPWEALFNGWALDFDAFHPPDEQWILFHPTVGFEASTVSFDDIQATGVVDIELLGYLSYYGDDYEHYFGGSLSATLRDDLGPGLGVVVHWSKSFSVGVSWHDDNDDGDYFDDDPYVFMSFDLFRFLQTEGPSYAREYDKVRALLAN